MNIEKQRKAFEEWAYSNKWNICRYPKSDYHMKEGQYCDEFVDGAWHGWQASANREGYKLVPIKCTNNMAHAAKEIDGRLSAFKYGDVWEAMMGACDE